LLNGLESETAGSGGVEYPFFLECDSGGRVLWMSDRTRSALEGFETLSSLVLGTALSCRRVMVTNRRVLISASLCEIARLPNPDVTALGTLQGNMLRHFFRLQRVERNLYTRVRQQKPGSGRQAIRQMERERQRLGRELHTGVGQLLAAIRLQFEVISAQLPEAPAPVRQALDRIATLAAEALEQVRFVSKRLHPPEWQRLTLEAALQQLWEMSGIPERYEASLRLESLPMQPEQEIKVLFYRGAQEALSNLTRHARATRIEMTLLAQTDRIALQIRDNGVGFDVVKLWDAPASVSSGIGLRSIREQAAAIGGKLEIESGPLGTTLVIAAPYSPLEA